MVVKQKFKLHYHSRNDSRGFVTDVIISSRGGHNINIGDVIEVYHPEDAHHALFLVTTLSDDLQNRDVISVEQSLAHTFKLQQHKNVIVNVINKETISLDLVELYFRDQYFSRRDFCNITQKLIGTVVHVNKKLTCNETRTQVGDLWRLGERYSCGYIDSKTKIIFRSSTAVIHIFIQMSQEMWWFDNNGDLYLEKAFKFLSKLFLKFWPENNCNHDTTVVFFTRIYIDDVPSEYSQSFKQDALSRYYEDFYRVIIQNERFTTDDWKRELGRMQYEVLQFENNIYSYLRNTYPLINKNSNKTKLNICTAMDANLLEVLNMAINLYSGYNIDRNFDRTGKLLFVITPGSGVYHVNENLLLLTKKRVLDLGVGVDLICLAEQPLHAVPLFKILSESFINPEEYVAPHWINCSYFKSAQELKYIEMGKPFPRVKVVSFKHSNDVPISTFFENLPRDDRQSDNQQTNVPKENCDDTIPTTTSITITKSSLPIYRIAYPSYQSPSNQNKRKKSHQLPNEVISGNLTKSHDSITSDYCSPSTVRHQLDGNPTHMTSSITDQSSSVESNLMPICCLNHTTQLSANAITAICRSKQAVSTSSSSYKNLSRSYDSYITSNSSITPLVSSTTVNGIDFGITSHNHIVNVDKYLPNNHIPTLLSRVPSISGSNNSGSGSISGYTTITSLPSVRERCIENGQSKSINDKSQILSIPMTPRNSRNRTQSFNGDQRAKLSYVDNHANFREIHNSVNEANYNVNSEGNSVEVAYLHENAISRCRTMDVILSDGQPSSSPWSIITPQHFTLRSCNSIDRRTNGTLSLSGLNSHTLPFIRRKSTITLYTTTTTTITTTSNTTNTNTPIHCGKFNSTTYSRNLTNYATTSLISGAYFPFGVSKNPYRMPISAGQRRWALVRPSDEYGGTITPHCIITSTDDIDFMYPAPLPYNLCQIWTAYFDFLRARFLDKRESNQTSVKDNNKNTDNHNNVNDVHRSIADIQHSSFSKSNAYISVKHLSAYDERPTEKDNLSNDRLPMTFPSISINSNHIPQLQFQDKTTSNSNNHSSTLPISVKLETEHPNHHRNNDNNSLLQTSANSKKALENLLEAIRHTMFSYSIQSSSLSTPYLSSMPSLSSAFWHQNQNITNTTTTTTTTTGSNNNNNSNSNAANNSSDDQKLFSVQMNNFNKLTNYKHMIPKRVGVDWKSLIVPACLPVDTDYFPDTCRLRSEWYTLHDYRVVPSGMSPDEWASMNNDCSEPGALYNRRQLTAREVFQEMVLQRISQGFQLCHEVVVHNPTNSNNVEHHSVTSINTSPNSIIQNDNLTNCSNNKPKTLSVIKQNNDRHTTPNSLHTTYHSRRISNISTTIIDTTTNNNINNSSSYIPTNRNTTNTTQFTKSTNRCLPTRLSSKFPTINNNTQPSRGSSVSSLSSVYNGRVLGVGLTINSSNRSVNQSNCHNSSRPSNNHSNNNNRNSNNRNVTTTIKSINRYKMKKSDNTTTTTTTTNAMFNSSLSKFGDTDQLLKVILLFKLFFKCVACAVPFI
uniref:DEP domain-containing protein n=1 Tax=Schistosoma mansoni TaxID=6183 RepID=A0A5K4F832_SCHMA